MKHKFITLLCCLLLPFLLLGQIPSNPIGINPAYLKWNQINTDKVQIIYPQGLEAEGQRVANMVYYLWENHQESVGNRMKKISILLQNQPVISNGLVTVGPYRSEFFMTSPQFNCTTNWLDILTIHEYRHAMQFGNSNHGITKVVKSIFGSWAWGGALSTVLPRWYLEGDATGMETALTASGRGRLPAFDMEFRSLALDGMNYGYEKAAAGSYKDFVPNWYSLGYYMTTKARKDYGKDFWQKVVDDATAYRGLIYPFGRAVKKYSGLSVKELYDSTYSELQQQWRAEAKRQPAAEILNQENKKRVTNYNNPHFLNDSILVVEKSGFDQLPTYYRLYPDQKEERIGQPGILLDAPLATLSYANGLLCWAELGFDIRRSNRTFSIIRTFDLNTKLKKKITTRTRLFSPALSANAEKIVAVEVTEDLKYQLVILSISDGSTISRLANPDNLFFMYPRWVPDQKKIVAVAQRQEGSRLVVIDLESEEMQALTPWSNAQITHPFATEDHIYFSSAYTGVNNIFAVDLEEKTIYQLTDDPLGAFQPTVSPDGKRLVFSAFDRMGYNVKEIPIERELGKPYDQNIPSSLTFFESLEEQEGGSIINKVPNKAFPVKKFNKWSGIINPHSWLPILDPPEVGARILSDNKFSTMSADVGAFYNTNEKEWTYDAGLSYAELFPVINLNYQHANRSGVIFNFAQENDSTIFTNFFVEEWAEDKFSAGLELPLILSKGSFFNSLRLRTDYQYIQVNPKGRFNNANNSRDTITGTPQQLEIFEGIYKPTLANTNFSAIDLRFIFRSFYRRAYQHTNPRWGLNLDLRYRSILGNSTTEGNVLLGRFDLFLPGIKRNHSLFFNAVYQKEDMLDNYRFPNFFGYPRGYNAFTRDELFKIGINYRLPILYPDLALSGLGFVKRVKATVFYDHGILKRSFPFAEGSTSMRSAGVELTFDVRVLRLLEFDFGLRYSYLFDQLLAPDQQQHQFDFLLISISE